MTEKLIDIAQKAGEAILKFYRKNPDVTRKHDRSPVTAADLASQKVILDELGKIWPDIPAIAEESAIPLYENRRHWPRFWLIDPLDGTREFINGLDEFTVNIALIENNRPVAGIVHLPASKTTWFGDHKHGSFKLDNLGHTTRLFSKTPDLSKPVTVVVSRSHESGDIEKLLGGHSTDAGNIIRTGSTVKFCLLAEGKADVYPRTGPTMEWDTAAGDAVFRFSGREAERYSPLTYNKPSMKNGGFIIGIQ